MRRFKLAVLIIVIFCMCVIVFRNMETVDVELVVTTVSMPLAALIATTLFIGILVGVLGRTVWNFTHWRKSKAKKT